MNHSIECVHCKAVLKSATPVPAGKKVKCPKCKQVFTTPEAVPAPPPEPAPPAAAAPEPAGAMNELDDMDAAIAKLEAEHTLGKKPAAPAPQPVAPAPAAARIRAGGR